MPIVNVKLVRDAFSPAQKRELVPVLTDAVERVYPGLRDVTFVTVQETEEWGIGGQAVDAEKVEAHAKHNLDHEG
ncbi:MAG: 4-oxalocrotonate tautomerase [Gammaproteobacteria bacterium]|jgi:4-oxalocrotonate tautomerase family enzyme|nr:4-oxalocrotonate tautomerase [Gammaproteobacteria bacterium]